MISDKISRNQLHLLLTERQPITPETAVKLEAALGGSARLWVNMEAAHDLWRAQMSTDLRDIKHLETA
jgi:addiction module HigA family antidote